MRSSSVAFRVPRVLVVVVVVRAAEDTRVSRGMPRGSIRSVRSAYVCVNRQIERWWFLMGDFEVFYSVFVLASRAASEERRVPPRRVGFPGDGESRSVRRTRRRERSERGF